MTEKPIGTIRSFIIVLYDGHSQERGVFSVPFSVVAPFANRLFREALPGRLGSLREPWYVLEPHTVAELPFDRATYPVGLTSLYGQRYVPEEKPPPRVTLHPEALVRYFTVRLQDFPHELYRGAYSVDDIFLAGVEYLARGWVEKGYIKMENGPFYYAIVPSAKEVRTAPPELFPPEAYQVEGVFQLPLLAEDRERTVFRRVPPPPLPERDPARYENTVTHGRGEPGAGVVLMHPQVYQALHRELALSDAVEEGGYLLGSPYRQPGSPEDEQEEGFRWLIEISDVVQAEHAWGRPAMLLFTGETWSQITRRIDRDYPDKKLLAWFHTHLFAGSDEFGLSGLDQDLHRRYLTKPWQVAVLVNIDAQGEREVRCFQRGAEGDLVECRFEVLRDASPRSAAEGEA